MAEPTLTGAATAAIAITFSGTVIGMPFDTLLAGFAGGLVTLSFRHQPLSVKAVIGTLSSSALLAGFFAQIVSLWAFTYYPWTQPLGESMRVTAAGGLGIGAQALIPAALNRLTAKTEVKS